jgi:hypothetical protein
MDGGGGTGVGIQIAAVVSCRKGKAAEKAFHYASEPLQKVAKTIQHTVAKLLKSNRPHQTIQTWRYVTEKLK